MSNAGKVVSEGSFTVDGDGILRFDCISGDGSCSLGRRPKAVVNALQQAIHETDQGNFPMISDEKSRLAEALAGFAPGDLNTVMFNVMRGEALDAACKIVRGATGHHELVTLAGSWFGETGFALSLSDRPDKAMYGPLVPGIRTVPVGDLAEAAKVLKKGAAGLVVQPVQVENGLQVLEPSYLQELRSICDRYDVMLVLDETWTAFGRCGARTFADLAGIVPDVMILGEALGAGVFPITATLFNPRGAAFLNQHPLIHLSTFGGSDIGCRVGLTALTEYYRLKPWNNAARAGRTWKDELSLMLAEYDGVVTGLTGLGLLWALHTSTAGIAGQLVLSLKDAGVLARCAYVARNTVLLCPSLVVTEVEKDELFTRIVTAVSTVCSSLNSTVPISR
jgi:putrescine aminotransferase